MNPRSLRSTDFAAITRGFNVVQPVSVTGFGYWNKVFEGPKYPNVEALGPQCKHLNGSWDLTSLRFGHLDL